MTAASSVSRLTLAEQDLGQKIRFSVFILAGLSRLAAKATIFSLTRSWPRPWRERSFLYRSRRSSRYFTSSGWGAQAVSSFPTIMLSSLVSLKSLVRIDIPFREDLSRRGHCVSFSVRDFAVEESRILDERQTKEARHGAYDF